ncbi:MAG: hypothetical protein P8R43_02435 [Planctomycetota bacterium]|jgi:hypothetical protein|nr:hypothetical protein [bacterium]MDG1490721.1 hypothetical protein [Planctomycetota bacterium]
MFEFHEAEELLRTATPPRAGSTSWYDACDLVATEIKRRLRERFERGFPVDVYGDEVGLIVRVRGDGYGVTPWSVDLPFDPAKPLAPQTAALLGRVDREVAAAYVVD